MSRVPMTSSFFLAFTAGVCLRVAAGCSLELRPETTDIVVAPNAQRTVRYAAEELRDFLSAGFGSSVALTTNPAPGRVHVYVGDSDWCRAAGIDVSALKRDAFEIRTVPDGVCIAGRDDPKRDPRVVIDRPWCGGWDVLHEHATLFGVYEFLERYAGVRMYFPGELGTVVPRRESLVVPNGTTKVEPRFLERSYPFYADGEYFEGTNRAFQLLSERKLNFFRQRMHTVYIPCCHGQSEFRLLRRFGKTHPEYFVQNADGTRRLDPNILFPGHLCQSSEVWNEIHDDIVSYVRGEGPEVRGMGSWNGKEKKQDWSIMAFRRPWVDVMPGDSFTRCHCPKCTAAYTDEKDYATDLVWGRTVELAQRLKDERVPIRITQMAYLPYGRVPDVEIPDNVDVMVAVSGPWTRRQQAEVERIRAWSEKLGHPVWIWTYPGKHGRMNIPDIPNPTPCAYGRYVKQMAPYVFGMYAEANTDRWLYNYLTYYVFGKLCWNPDVDVEALLDEHFRLMFGAAAQPMADFIRQLEDKWVNEVAGREIETALGPQRMPPSQYEIYTRIYSIDVLRSWRELFVRAKSQVPPNSIEWRRIGLYEREMLLPLATAAKRFRTSISVERELLARTARPAQPNLLVNGSFDQSTSRHSGYHFGGVGVDGKWAGGWIGSKRDEKNYRLVKDVPSGLPCGLEIAVSGSAKTVPLEQEIGGKSGPLKPGHRYRLSYFVKLDDVRPAGSDGGVCARIWHDRNIWLPTHKLVGSMDWIHQEFFFTAGSNADKCQQSCTLYLWNATGKVTFAGVRLEECP